MKFAKIFKRSTLLLLIMSMLLVAGVVFNSQKGSASAYTASYVSSHTASDSVDQIFNSTKKAFDRSNLDAFAQKASYANFSALMAGVNGGDIKDAGDFNNALVKFGEYTFGGTKRDLIWIPAYLKKDGGNVILTLWLASTASSNGAVSNQEVSYWSDGTYKYWFASGSNPAPPTGGGSATQTYNGSAVYAHTYDGSYIRNVILLGKGSGSYTHSWGYYYNTSTSAAATYTGTRVPTLPADRTKFTTFTTGDLAQYLVAPASVSWQTSQTGMNDIGYNSTSAAYHKNYYPSTWRNDKIWLPSNYEIRDSGLWGITQTQRAGDACAPTRTATTAFSSEVVRFSTGGVSEAHAVSMTFAVRPALHLNLTSADVDSGYLYDDPQNVTKTFNNVAEEIKDFAPANIPTWYSSDFENTSKFTMTYYNSSNSPVSEMKNSGTYWVKIEATSGYQVKFFGDPNTVDTNHVESDTVRWFKFTIEQKAVDFPKFYNNITKKTYAGGTNLNFELQALGPDASAINIQVPANHSSDVTYDAANNIVTASKVGKYELNVTLNSNNYKWATTDNKLEFEIEKATIKLELDNGSGNKALVGVGGQPLDAYLRLDANFVPHTSRTVSVNIIAKATGLNPRNICSIDLNNLSRNELVSLNLSTLHYGTHYTLEVEIDDTKYDGASYKIEKTDVTTLTVEDPSSKPKITWVMYSDGIIDSSRYMDVEITNVAANAIVTFDKGDIKFDKKVHEFKVSLPSGYTLDNTYGIGGYDISCTNSANTQLGKNAGVYSTKVRIQETSSGNQQVYEIKWQILTNMFDLSGVKWLNDGKMEYNGGAKIDQIIDVTTLPEGLLVDEYGDMKDGYNVGPCGQVSVTFKLADDYVGNFELPAKNGKDTNYLFSGDGDFEWDKNWEIVPAVFKLQWKDKQVTDNDGNTFNVRILEDTRAVGKVDYVYYETNALGDILNPSDAPITENQIVYSKTDRKYYKAYPTILGAFSGNYVFENNNTADYSNVFYVGGGASLVSLSLDLDSYEYSAKPVSLTSHIVINGAATHDQLTFTYYKGEIVNDANKVDGVPKDAGKYLVVITSNTDTVELSGTTQFAFDITKSIVSTEWKTDIKPPVLNLKTGQNAGIAYDIVDENDIPIASVADITVGDYKIRARITDTVNYIFDDDTIVTDWQVFTVNPGDQIYDPVNPLDPVNPPDQNNPNPTPGPDDGDDKGSSIGNIFKNLIEKKFPLWQIATSAVAVILTLIFMAKAIQYSNKAKQAKGEAKKLNAKAYSAFLPVFSTEIVLAGLSNKIWSIIAFSLVGVTVLMFVLALVMRKSWKKAELAKENAMENREQRKVQAEKEEREAEKKERIAFQERMVQAGSQSAGAADSSLFEQRLLEMEERHRQEMERRDEAMKMMLANLMGRQAGNDDMIYGSLDDTDLLVQKVIAGLLPAVQQMVPEATAYLTAPNEQNEELLHIVEEQNAQMQAMTEQMNELQAQLASMHEIADAVIMPDSNDEIKAMTDEINALRQQIASLGNQPVTMVASDNSDLVAQMNALQKQLAELGKGGKTTVVNSDNSDLLAEMNAMRKQMAMLAQSQYDMSILDDEDEDMFDDDEEEWDSILDEDEEDNFVESVIIEADGTVRKVSPNFRMRLKQSSDKNRDWYAVIKNLFCSQKGVTYRVQKRVEKIRYQGQVIGVIGIAKRSIKLWLALKPYEYDARRYHHKDVSDKPRFVDVPMYVRVGSDRALERAQELILALFQEFNMEARKRYHDRDIQELIFTLKHNKLLNNKYNKTLLRETVHVHDCDVLDDETAQKCVETKNVDFTDESVIETVKLDDIDTHFLDGNRVTLEKLRKAGLVSEECTGVNIVADKRLTKPLIIVANDFSLSAVKLIVLTGGRAIRLTQVNR